MYSEQNCKIESTVKWNSIDTTLILPYHTKNGLMPGMFPPHQMCKSHTSMFSYYNLLISPFYKISKQQI